MVHNLTFEAIRLADRTCCLVDRLLKKQQTDPNNYFRVVMLAHSVRIIRFTQAAVTLMHAGLFEPACAMTRTVMEMGWVLLAIQAEPEKFFEWHDQASGEAIKSLRRLKSLGEHERSSNLSNANIDIAIASMPTGKKLDLKAWAIASGAEASYYTLYQMLSSCAHGELNATFAYTRWDEATENLTGIQDPDLADLPADSLMFCVAILLDGIRFVAGDTLHDNDLREIGVLEAIQHALSQQLSSISEANTEDLNRKTTAIEPEP